uniref:Cytochrome c maturation protein CcmE n=1 Tax=Strombidium rassoulzadegani TaxID=1082188 RepID=A0A7S3CSZ1_9SPIT|mmetsp:Transcript_5247/g.8863  ORF Transcript_5247/g.8863 Transcript_5247/m.8863 type:complete len:160 (+) Transcript_5247:222-701(+)
MILKRIVIFRLLFYTSLILSVGSLLEVNKNKQIEQSVTPSYFLLHSSLPGQRFKVQGVIKHDSIQMKKGTLENKFVMTDFKNDLQILFKGTFPQTFREGDMATVGGFLADPKNPTVLIATDVQANHDIEPDKWIGDTSFDKMVSINMVEPQTDFEYTKM